MVAFCRSVDGLCAVTGVFDATLEGRSGHGHTALLSCCECVHAATALG